MPPFDRRSKTPTVARPSSGFDAPANSAKVARMPWEREDDDEFGPPPALDVAPEEAESEAKRMIYEKTHPMHEALMQNAHLDHNRAMRRYTALARRAWDPAARDIPVKPARVVGEDDISASVPGTTMRNANLRTLALKNPKDEVLPPVSPPTPKPIIPEPPAEKPKVRGPRLIEQRPIPSETVVARAASDARVADTEWIENIVVERIDGTRPLDPIVVEDRALGEQQARERGAAARRSDPDALVPPHAINLDRFAAAQAAIDARNDLSETEKYVLLGLIGYEDISPDIAGKSFGGITASSFNSLREIVSDLRILEGKPPISATDQFDLTIDELLDFQRAYLTRELDPASNFPLPGDDLEDEKRRQREQQAALFIRDSNILDRLGPNPLAFQIADSVFNYGTDGRMNILQYAVTETIRQMTPRQRSLGGYAYIDRAYINPMPEDKGDATDATLRAVLALASDPVHQHNFLDLIRIGRAYLTARNGSYAGNNRWRIWGITKE